MYPVNVVVSYDKVNPVYRCFVNSIDKLVEPKNFHEASKDENWVKAMKEEISALENNKTWKLVNLREGNRTIGCKWVYEIKYNSDGSLERYKARLLAKGYNQKNVICYVYTFSLFAKMVTVRILLSIAAIH